MRRLAVTLALALCLGGCAERDAGQSGRVEIPTPNLADRDESVRRQLEAARAELDALLAQPEIADEALARGYGDAGRIYHAYALTDVALACYENARRLDETDPRWLYYPALLLFERGEFDDAAELFEGVLRRRPDDLPTLLRLGELRLTQGRLSEATARYERALEIAPDSAAALFGLGRVATMERDHERAVTLFERALALAPEATMIHYPLSQAYRKLDREAEADRHLAERGIGSVAFDDPLLAALGALTEGTSSRMRSGSEAMLDGRFEEAEAAFRAAVEENPRDPQARSSLAMVLARQDRHAEALAEFREADAIEPDAPGTLFNIGWLEAALGDEGAALATYRRAIEIDPNHLQARLELARLLEAGGRAAEALTHVDAALAVDPQHTAAALARARLLTALGRHDEAIAGLRATVTALPEDAPAHLALGTALSAAGRPDPAAAALERAVALGLPEEQLAVAHYNLGVVATARGRSATAAEHYAAAIEADPSMVDARYHLANAYARQGDYARAAKAYAALLELAPGHLAGRVEAATALTLDGRFAAARETLQTGLATSPGEPLLEMTLARLLATCPDPAIRDGARAVDLARSAHASLDSSASIATVAMAYAEAGRFEEAVRWQRRLVDSARGRGADAEAARHTALLELFEGQRPYRLATPEEHSR